MKSALVLGGTGFIGHHMARRLKQEGYYVRVVDIQDYQYGDPYEFADSVFKDDLREIDRVYAAIDDGNIKFDEIYVFCCLMGGAGFVFTKQNDAEIMADSALMNINVAKALTDLKFKGKVFYSSSACIYPEHIQLDPNNQGLKEDQAWPANPDSVYGLEKIFSEKLYDAFLRNHGLDIRIARFHNIYGPEGTYKPDSKTGIDKSKAPAAMCRKVAERSQRGVIEIWGDGEQTRSFLYIDDCIDAVRLLIQSDFKEPINIGSEEMVSINQLAQIVINISGKEIQIAHDLNNKALGVRGRNSNNDLIRKVLGWEPKYTLKEGLTKTYQWIESQVKKEKGI